MSEIRVAIAGVGNCASALVQGVHYYRDASETDVIPGLMHVRFGEYHIGKDLSEAIFVEPNCCAKFANPMPKLGVKVLPGPILDGVGPHMKEAFKVEDDDPINVAEALKEADADMLVNFLPVGSYEATRFYAEAALEAGCAFVNCIPEFIACR